MIEVTQSAQANLSEHFKQNSIDSAIRVYIKAAEAGPRWPWLWMSLKRTTTSMKQQELLILSTKNYWKV